MTKYDHLGRFPATLLAMCAALALFVSSQSSCNPQPPPGNGGAPPQQVVKFGMLPYGDHTYAIIGVKQGWFKEVGIDLQYQSIKVEEIVPLLKNNTMDVISSPPGILISSYDNAPNLCSFVFGDLFQGYAVLAQSNAGYKSYTEFVAEGMPPADAARAAAQQLKGKKFAYPTETAIKPFIDLVLERGGLKRTDFQALVLDDPLTVNAMRSKQADFQVGGVPSRIVLEREGFKPIISSIDLVRGAAPSADSKELASILQNGWAMTKEYYQREHDTTLRLASVNYRIMKFINTNQQQALALHMPYLSEVSGQSFSEADGKVIYNSLNPFVTFEDQGEWFHNTQNPLYFKYVNGAIIKSFVDQGVFKNTPPGVDDVIYADDVYFELERLKQSAEEAFRQIDARESSGGNDQQTEKYRKAKYFYEIYNYLDAERLAKEILVGNNG
jgi:ABC-type nitrate/sulfonate/bicarbonate transport system substrate-binding protein